MGAFSEKQGDETQEILAAFEEDEANNEAEDACATQLFTGSSNEASTCQAETQVFEDSSLAQTQIFHSDSVNHTGYNSDDSQDIEDIFNMPTQPSFKSSNTRDESQETDSDSDTIIEAEHLDSNLEATQIFDNNRTSKVNEDLVATQIFDKTLPVTDESLAATQILKKEDNHNDNQ